MICMQDDFILFELSIGYRVLLNCILVVLNVAELSQALAERYTGVILLLLNCLLVDFTLVGLRDLIAAELSSW